MSSTDGGRYFTIPVTLERIPVFRKQEMEYPIGKKLPLWIIGFLY